MKLIDEYLAADGAVADDIQKTGTYMVRVWGTFGGGTLTLTEKESGLTIDTFAAAERVEVTLERGQTVVATLAGATNPKLRYQVSLLQWLDDTDRRAENGA